MPEEPWREVLEITNRLALLSVRGDYIYRGEPRYYPRISSSLYREYPVIESANFDIESLQDEFLYEAERYSEAGIYTNAEDQLAILIQLQHYGGKTNLIDFTTDCLIALFFACDGEPNQDGRVVLLRKSGRMKFHIHLPPPGLTNRIAAQKSAFVRPPAGYIEPDDLVRIPQNLKLRLLEYLRLCHNISPQTVYNDFHGFIRQQNIHREAYAAYLEGVAAQHREEFHSAISHYDKAIELYPQFTHAYAQRGDAYLENGQLAAGLQDYTQALALDPKLTDGYVNRGLAHCDNGDFDAAILDFDSALELDSGIVEAYLGRGIAFGENGDYLRAIQNLQAALELEPRPEIYRNLGNTYNASGDLERAVESYTQALNLVPDDELCLYDRAEVYLRQGQWALARADLIAARELGADIAALFHRDYADFSDFAAQTGLSLPADILEMLGG